MMSIKEYALDVDRTVNEILRKCQELGITAEEDYMLTEDEIVELDNEASKKSLQKSTLSSTLNF